MRKIGTHLDHIIPRGVSTKSDGFNISDEQDWVLAIEIKIKTFKIPVLIVRLVLRLLRILIFILRLINRPGVAGAVL